MADSPAEKIVFVTQYFYPDESATSQLLTDLAEGLVGLGYNIKVYTGRQAYQDGKDLPRDDTYKGIEINRVLNTQFDKDRIIGRVANGISFLILVLTKLLLMKGKKCTLFINTNPPYLPLLAYVLSKVRSFKYVVLVQDIYPDAAIKKDIIDSGSYIAAVWDYINRLFTEEADATVTLGKSMKENLLKKVNGNSSIDSKVHVVPNWADGKFLKPINKEENWFAREHNLLNKTVVLYSGNIGRFHHFQTVVDSAIELNSRDDLLFLFIGDGAKKTALKRAANQHTLNNFKFLPYQPKENLPYSLTAGDLSLITLEKELEGLAIPCKIYTSLASGLPLLAVMGDDTEAARIINEYDCGFRVDQGDSDGLSDVLIRCASDPALLDEMGENARSCFEDNFTSGHAVQKYDRILSSL